MPGTITVRLRVPACLRISNHSERIVDPARHILVDEELDLTIGLADGLVDDSKAAARDLPAESLRRGGTQIGVCLDRDHAKTLGEVEIGVVPVVHADVEDQVRIHARTLVAHRRAAAGFWTRHVAIHAALSLNCAGGTTPVTTSPPRQARRINALAGVEVHQSTVPSIATPGGRRDALRALANEDADVIDGPGLEHPARAGAELIAMA